VKDTIYIRDELVLEAHPQGDSPHILLRREGEGDAVRIYLNEVRYLADVLCAMAAELAGSCLAPSCPSTPGAHMYPTLVAVTVLPATGYTCLAAENRSSPNTSRPPARALPS
jgi:hypothetical protein